MYVQAYGITLLYVLKHDSAANFWCKITLLQYDKKQTSKLLGCYHTVATCVPNEVKCD